MKKLAAMVLLTLSLSANATFVDGNRLYGWMNGDTSEQRMGMTYIAGVFDSLQGLGQCAPLNVTLGQVNSMVKMSLAANPAIWNEPANDLVIVILNKYWPCPKNAV